MTTTLLHLSDIHTGPGEFKDEDLKDHLPGVERKKMLDRLTTYVRALPAVPDYVAVTGDITLRGNREGLTAFYDWLLARMNEGLLPDTRRILVVPGNHDVRWKVKESPGWHRKRYQDFGEILGTAFPHSHLPGFDPPLDASLPSLSSDSDLIGGLSATFHAGRVHIETSFPFLLDLERDLLLFAFNSTLGCGVYLQPEQVVIDNLQALEQLHPEDSSSGRALRAVRKAYLDSLLVDAGMLGDPQLDYFAHLMARLRNELGSKYHRLTKVALLHHHISHLWRQQLEVKKFESVLDASQLKQLLVEYGYDLVLHGHKHLNHVGIDGSIIPLSRSASLNPLFVVSGGTVGGQPRTGDQQSFKLISFSEDAGPRTVGSITQVPLDDVGDPRRVIRNGSKIYPIRIASYSPEVHDFAGLKKNLDAIMRRKRAPELKTEKVVYSGARAEMPPAHPDLVAETSKYRFDHIVERDGQRLFYAVILATRRLDFGHRARIYWMLNDVKHLAEATRCQCRIILLIGNLESTSLSEAVREGEVQESIQKLLGWFRPAIESGLFEVRVQELQQDEVEAATRSLMRLT